MDKIPKIKEHLFNLEKLMADLVAADDTDFAQRVSDLGLNLAIEYGDILQPIRDGDDD